jgi:predicted amidophosphoribosyltransferase
VSDLCLACHQPLPVKGSRSCARCLKPIKRHDRWHAIGSLIFHKDCNDRTLSGVTVDLQQQQLLEVTP